MGDPLSQYSGTGITTSTYQGSSITPITTSAYNWKITDPGHSHEYRDPKEARKLKLAEMESLVSMYRNLKIAKADDELLKPIEDTIKRYTAELFYLEPTPIS